MATRAIANLLEESERRQEEKKQECARKRIKQVAAIIVVLVIALTCAILSAPSVTAPSGPRRIPAHYTQSEILTPEDREIMKDVRTSFIPTGSIVLPPSEEIQNLVEKEHEELLSAMIDTRTTDEDTADIFSFKVYLGVDETSSERSIEIDNATTLNDETKRFKRESSNLTATVLPWRNNQNGSTEKETWNLHPDVIDEDEADVLDYEEEIPRSHSEHDETKEDIEEEHAAYSENFQPFWKRDGDRESIRRTQGEMMKQYMDLNADPCTDFYQYACGNWAMRHPIPADKTGFDTFEMVRENLDIVLRDLLSDLDSENSWPNKDSTSRQRTKRVDRDLIRKQNNMYKNRRKRNGDRADNELGETKPQYGKDIDAVLKAKYLYKSCMNYKIIESRGHQPLLNLLESLGGWPIIDPNWNASKFDWIELVAELRLYNNDILISEWVGPDLLNSDEFVIQLDQTSLGLPTKEYFIDVTNKVYLEGYRNFFVKIATLLGASSDAAKNQADEVIEFETKLAGITSTLEERKNVTQQYHRSTLHALMSTIPDIDWQRYLNIVINRKVELNETVVIFALKYLKDLVKVIEESQPRTIANYLLWRFVRHRVSNLDDRFQEAKQKFYYILFGREQSPPRWKNCVSQVNSNMGMALGSMFVSKYFDENSKNDTLIMTREIQKSFKELLNMTSWIDDETKQSAGEKVDSMLLKIGYPGFILNREELNERYKDVIIHPETYFENTLNVLQHLTKTEQSRLGQIVNKTHWNTVPAIVNAYYSRNKNQIMFPAGILQPPFYHRYFPKSLNYGGIGVVIGHEITHGFDDKGRLFDKHGNLNSWWKEIAKDMFHQKAQCIIDQYGLYTVSEVTMPLDGIMTQGENIADNGGIKQAFRAYKLWLQQNDNADETLPGLNATNTQLFFLNFAQVWCGSTRPEAMKNKLKTAVHSPGKFRVIGTLSNSEDFAKVFKCPAGSPMNPANKCDVW